MLSRPLRAPDFVKRTPRHVATGETSTPGQHSLGSRPPRALGFTIRDLRCSQAFRGKTQSNTVPHNVDFGPCCLEAPEITGLRTLHCMRPPGSSDLVLVLGQLRCEATVCNVLYRRIPCTKTSYRMQPFQHASYMLTHMVLAPVLHNGNGINKRHGVWANFPGKALTKAAGNAAWLVRLQYGRTQTQRSRSINSSRCCFSKSYF